MNFRFKQFIIELSEHNVDQDKCNPYYVDPKNIMLFLVYLQEFL